MRRIPLLASSLGGLAVLSLTAFASAGPPKLPPMPKGGSATIAVDKDKGKATLVVAPAQEKPAKGDKKLADADKDKGDKQEKAEKQEDPVDRARKGVVTIERAGEVLGLGTVLKDDGRVITALSSLGDGNALDLRYADGSIVHAKVGHSDRVWDLALLVPQVGRWPDGLGASNADPLKKGAQLRAFAPGKSRAQPATLVVKGRRSLLGADEQLLRDVLEVGTRIGPKEFGSPVVDGDGNVVAMLGRACVPVEKGPCLPSAFGVPVDALRQFLRTAPPSAVPPAAWLGIQGVPDRAGPVQGVRVVSVSPESPADEAGLKGGGAKDGDVVVALDDAPVPSAEALSKLIAEKAVGDRVKILLFGGGKFREVTAVLTPAPLKR